MENVFLLFDDHIAQKCLLFKNPHAQIIATKAHEIPWALSQISILQKQGFYCAGYITYEAGCTMMDIPYHPSSTPLLEFYAFHAPHSLPQEDMVGFLSQYADKNSTSSLPADHAAISALEPTITFDTYKQALTRIAQGLSLGEFYQLNYTFPLSFKLHGSVAVLFSHLRMQQKVAYGAWLSLGDRDVLSLSPELFFKKTGNTITCKPMKGTIKRGLTSEEDNANTHYLQNDPKSRAENLMIVDLLRNDLSRISEKFSVTVEELFKIETYETLHQMVSTISSRISPALTFGEILDALFPCGSITGAPKHAAMHMIHQLEPFPRQIYTGAMGYITPKGDMCMNVPIRTMTIHKNGYGEMGVGSGIVADSDILSEWEECLLKAKFLSTPNKNFNLLEAFLLPAGEQKPLHLERHLKRLHNSAQTFNFVFDEHTIRQKIEKFCSAHSKIHPHASHKVRLAYSYDGHIDMSATPITVSPHPLEIDLETEYHPDPEDIFLYHKTTYRKPYDDIWHKGQSKGLYDMLLINRNGIITEATRHNFFIRKNGHYYTSPLSVGLLNGIQRELLLETNPHFHEKPLFIQDLLEADDFYLSNAVRGMVKVVLNAKSKDHLIRSLSS